jgi:hypothetical protein
MEDIAPKLLEKIQAEFSRILDSDENIKKLYEQVKNGTATYQEANKFAIQVGKLLSRTFGDTLSSEVLPDGKMYYNIAQRILNPMLKKNYDLVSEVCTEVQTTMNKAAGIGIAVKKPDINQDRLQGIIDIVSGKENFDDIAYMLKEPIVNFSQSIAADFVKENVEMQGKMGLVPKIKRIAIGRCCEWCSNLEGVYDYPNVPHDVYRRHKNCRCMVVYDPADGKRRVQNVYTKQWNSEEENDKLNKRKLIGLQRTGKMTSKEYENYKRELSKVYSYEQIYLEKQEYAHVMSEINSNLSDEDMKHAIVSKPIGNYVYTFINKGFDNYVIIGKKEIV